MGSSNSSRRRRMSERDDGNRDSRDGDDVDLPAILAYLIRSGQVRIMTSDDPDDDQINSSDDEEFYGTARPPQVDHHPDTTSIKKSDIQNEVMMHSGRAKRKQTDFGECGGTVTQMLGKRELGINKQRHFTVGDCRVMNTPFLPNHHIKVASYHHKAFCGTFSKEGNIFLSASQDQMIRIYDTQKDKFELFKSIRARDVGWSVLDTAFSPDGNYLIYSSWSDCIHLCNIYGEHDTHDALHLFPNEGSFCIFSLTFSSDNREIMGGANDGSLYVFDRDSNQRTLKIDAHEDDVNAVSFADDSSHIIFSGGDDGLIKVWDRRTLREEDPIPVGTLAGHYDGITYIDSKNDARYLLSNAKDQTMKLWDVRVFSTADAVTATKKAVSNQRWDYRWQQVPRKLNQKKKRLPGDTSVMTYRGHSVLHTLIRCHFSPEFTTGQRYVYSGCATGSVVIFDLLTGKIVTKLNGHRYCVRDISWHPYENIIMSSSWDGSVGKWDYKYQDESDMEDKTVSDDTDEECIPRRSRRLREQRHRYHSPRLHPHGLFD